MDNVAVIKVVANLLYPLGLVILFLVFGLLIRLLFGHSKIRRLANFCYFMSICIGLIFSNPIVATWLVESLEKQYPQTALHDIVQHDAILVLGGGLRIPLPPAQHSQLTAGSDRYWYAARLYKSAKAGKVVLLGGNVYEQSGLKGEAFYASQLLQEWGVPAAAIIVEDQSRTTEQNSANAISILQANDIKSALLITSAIHMPRAYILFENGSVDITPASADVIVRPSNAPKVFSWLPSARALSLSTVALHEYYGRWFAQLNALISKA